MNRRIKILKDSLKLKLIKRSYSKDPSYTRVERIKGIFVKEVFWGLRE